MAYSYSGVFPNQQLKNSGVFTTADALNLQAVGEWGGSLELIQSQTLSGATACNFTALKGARYNTHLLQIINFSMDSSSSNEKFNIRFSNDGGSSYENSNYEYGMQYGESDGTFGEIDSTSGTSIENFMFTASTSSSCNSYVYFNNLNDANEYSYARSQSVNYSSSSVQSFIMGFGCYKVTELINGISIYGESSSAFSGTANLYGIKEI